MKLEILVRSVAYGTTYEAAANDPDNAGLSEDAILWQQGQNQEAFPLVVDENVQFEIEKDQEGLLEEIIGSPLPHPKLEGRFKLGDVLSPGSYFFDGRQVVKSK